MSSPFHIEIILLEKKQAFTKIAEVEPKKKGRPAKKLAEATLSPLQQVIDSTDRHDVLGNRVLPVGLLPGQL